ncbi:hypothetical protein HX096_04320 [Empedobacter falsenii]|uniref:hypothetical protein n=1 Tax=Empedobacter falsenii TaxID=343874 RepID=UPI0025762783|nr:hypothetical protein [Empedobacter falsenii]MDM1547080.1 hypothetical protein [Empedobacter falsenii]
MTKELIQIELNRLIHFLEMYKNAEYDLSKAKNNSERKDAKHNIDISKISIKQIFELNKDLIKIVTPKDKPTNQYEYISDSFISTHFAKDIEQYITKIQEYLESK